jgi:putative ABC transport system permease protein
MIYTNIKMALKSIRSARTRSFLTMLGIIIGVMSVVVTVSLGEGVKNQVVKQINQLGSDTIIIRPGKIIEQDANGTITKLNINASIGASTLTEEDIKSIKSITNVKAVAPSFLITSTVSTPEKPEYQDALVIATNDEMPEILNQEIEYGDFFDDDDTNKRSAVIGSTIANEVFNQRDPIGRVMVIRGEEFTVRGVYKQFPTNPINFGQNYNDTIFIPFSAGKSLIGGASEIRELNIKLVDPSISESTKKQINTAVLANHSGQNDFTILNQSEFLDATNQVFTILTTLVAAVAGISLLVGGIGIMNIMLVSVSERTKEIGVRKAIGASNKQILTQFLVEAIVLSAVGGFFGVLLSMIAAYFIKISTSITPSISITTIVFAVGIATIVGVVFGMAPAIKAARKDPISALRHE